MNLKIGHSPVVDGLIAQFMAMRNDDYSEVARRFFKTAPGQYGEGDCFLGIRVPDVRKAVKPNIASATLSDVELLTASSWHELRLAGFMLLLGMFEKALRLGNRQEADTFVECYLSIIERGNNWDLVDLVAPGILGRWLVTNPAQRNILDRLASMQGCLWHQRVAVVSTFTLIKEGEYADALRVCTSLMSHTHDLIHKATGWMLREIGKRGGMPELLDFLDRYAAVMPRTMLRYAIERLPSDLRLKYMSAGRK